MITSGQQLAVLPRVVPSAGGVMAQRCSHSGLATEPCGLLSTLQMAPCLVDIRCCQSDWTCGWSAQGCLHSSTDRMFCCVSRGHLRARRHLPGQARAHARPVGNYCCGCCGEHGGVGIGSNSDASEPMAWNFTQMGSCFASIRFGEHGPFLHAQSL